MEFRVIFSPHPEVLVERELPGISDLLYSGLGNHFREKRTRMLPERRRVGIHVLDLYRNATGDNQVSINDIPSNIAENWRDNKYFAVSIDEETARSSGRFLEYDTFYCKASLDVMMEFETVDIVDKDTEDPKLIVSIDKDKILSEWIKQGHPKTLSPANKTEPEESEK